MSEDTISAGGDSTMTLAEQRVEKGAGGAGALEAEVDVEVVGVAAVVALLGDMVTSQVDKGGDSIVINDTKFCFLTIGR